MLIYILISCYLFISIFFTGVLYGQSEFDSIKSWRKYAAFIVCILFIPIIELVTFLYNAFVKWIQFYEIRFLWNHYINRKTYSEKELEQLRKFYSTHMGACNHRKAEIIEWCGKLAKARFDKAGKDNK